MKTLVIFALPDNTCRTCHLSDRALTPYRGHRYLFEGKLYEVAFITEVLELVEGNTQYLALLELLSGGAESGAALPQMVSLSKESDSGGIVLAGGGDGSGLLEVAEDHVLLVQLKRVKQSGTQSLSSLLQLGQAAETQKLVAGHSAGEKKRKRRRGRRGRGNGSKGKKDRE